MIIPIGDEIVQEERFIPIMNDVIPGADPCYLISTWGRVYNSKTQNLLPKNVEYNKDHYITIRLNDIYGNPIMIQPHRMLMMICKYIPGCEELDVNHKDGIKYHNWIWNLEWSTHKENMQHAVSTGLFNLGETRGNSNITNEQANFICKLIQDGKSPSEIESITGIKGAAAISKNIRLGYSWKHVSCNYDFSNAFKRGVFTDEEIHMICRVFELLGAETSTNDVLDMIHHDYDSCDIEKIRSSVSGYRKKKLRKDICELYDY